MPKDEPLDAVDEIVEQWTRERPELDVSGMAIIGRISRLEKLIRPQLDAVFAQHDLQSWEFDVLATLVRQGPPHQLTPGQLLDSTMITSGAMTNRIDRLEQRDLVIRTKSPTDGRQVLVKLTKKGMKVMESALVDHTVNERAIVDGLTPAEHDQLVTLLRRLHQSVQERPDHQ